MPRADLNVHTKYSNRSTNFFLKRLNASESLTEPEDAYRLAKRRGMDFVTFTDTDTLAGCEELAHHPDVFCSCETHVIFPEDECKIKLLVYGLTDVQLSKLLSWNGNIYKVRDYLAAEKIMHCVAAPLEVHNLRLSPDHIERLILLFDHFETRSGGRQARTNEFLSLLLDRLTPELMDRLQKKWGIEPTSDRPWQKGCLGGSADYCGEYVGLTWTEVPAAKTAEDFLQAVARRDGQPGGIHGSTLSRAHSMYRIAFKYYQRNLRKKDLREPDLVSLVMSQVLKPEKPRKLTARELLTVTGNILKRVVKPVRRPSAVERRLLREFLVAYNEVPFSKRLRGIHPDEMEKFDERLYDLADRVISRVSFRLLRSAIKDFGRGRLGNSISLFAAVLPLQAILGPYLYAFDKLNQDRKLIADIEERFGESLELGTQHRKKIAWFSDTVSDVNGVSMTLEKMAKVAEDMDADLTIISCIKPENAPEGSRFLNFEPSGELSFPDYETQTFSIPPFPRILKYLEAEDYTEYVISTPAVLGILAMFASKLFDVPCRAIYHTDFPQHVRLITGDEELENSTWTYMRMFYGAADAVYSPSEAYRQQLAEHGFDLNRLFIFTRGTDLEVYNPRHRDERFFESWGIKDRVVLIYAGRVSREKNLDPIFEAFQSDPELMEKAALVLLGDGPYREELKQRHGKQQIIFPGFLTGKALARAYASADVFVFPSTTDTYGNSVLEAHASGLPAIVSDEGGPKEIIIPGESGLALPGHDVEGWRKAMHELVFNQELRHRMSAAARARAATRDWATAFREFWEENPYPQIQQTRREKVIR